MNVGTLTANMQRVACSCTEIDSSRALADSAVENDSKKPGKGRLATNSATSE